MTGWARTSRHARGYDWEWERLRLRILERDGYLCRCAECRSTGRLRCATEVDHVIPKAWFRDGRAKGNPDDPSNLAAIHHECHRIKTQREQGRPLRERPTYGLDGHPIE